LSPGHTRDMRKYTRVSEVLAFCGSRTMQAPQEAAALAGKEGRSLCCHHGCHLVILSSCIVELTAMPVQAGIREPSQRAAATAQRSEVSPQRAQQALLSRESRGEALYVREALTGSAVVEAAQSLVVLGDVPDGAVLRSDGDIIVFGGCASPPQRPPRHGQGICAGLRPPLTLPSPDGARGTTCDAAREQGLGAGAQAARGGARRRGRRARRAGRRAHAGAAAAQHRGRRCARPAFEVLTQRWLLCARQALPVPSHRCALWPEQPLRADFTPRRPGFQYAALPGGAR
jgi:hypothetical protein